MSNTPKRADGFASDSAPPPKSSSSRGFFDVYKPGQGYHTRVGTALVAGAMVCWGGYALYQKLDLFNNRTLQVFLPVGVIIGLGILGYWALALNRKIGDFLIATEGEMKKVNWTSRKEVIGATKVVILMVIVMSAFLFVVDLTFMAFFGWVGVLKGTAL